MSPSARAALAAPPMFFRMSTLQTDTGSSVSLLPPKSSVLSFAQSPMPGGSLQDATYMPRSIHNGLQGLLGPVRRTPLDMDSVPVTVRKRTGPP